MTQPVSQSVIRARAYVAESREFVHAARRAALRGAKTQHRLWEAQRQLWEAERHLELVVRREREEAIEVAVNAAFDKAEPNPWR